MASISTTGITIVGVIIGGRLYLYFHEYTHWAAGKLFSGDPKVLYDSWHKIPYPYAVEYRELEQMSDWEIRIAGIAPHIVWTTVAISYLDKGFSAIDMNLLLMISRLVEGMHSTPFPTLVFVIASVVAGASVSPSDLVATFYPRRYREYTGRGFSHSEWGRVLMGEID